MKCLKQNSIYKGLVCILDENHKGKHITMNTGNEWVSWTDKSLNIIKHLQRCHSVHHDKLVRCILYQGHNNHHEAEVKEKLEW